MDKGLSKAFEKLTEALQFTRDKGVVSIRPCMNIDKDGYYKEVAKITFTTGTEIYADIGGDANTAAMYDVLAVLCQQKPRSRGIYKVIDLTDDEQNDMTSREDLEKRVKDLKRDLSIQIARAENLDLMLNDYRNRAERAEMLLRMEEENDTKKIEEARR